jgi:hypothetical protein
MLNILQYADGAITAIAHTQEQIIFFSLTVLTMIIILLTFVTGRYSFYSHTSFHIINYTDSHMLPKSYGQSALQ